jgi:hypothetical protein
MLRILSRAHRSQVHCRTPSCCDTDQVSGGGSAEPAVPHREQAIGDEVDATRIRVGPGPHQAPTNRPSMVGRWSREQGTQAQDRETPSKVIDQE